MIRPPGACLGVCNIHLPLRIKKSIRFYLLNQKPGTFWIAGLYGLSIPDEKPLKFVWTHPKPAEDRTNMAIFAQNPPGMGRIWPYSRKTRRGSDEYGHIHAKPDGDGTNMAIFTQNPPRIGRIWPYLCKTRRGSDEYGHFHAKPAGDRMNIATAIESSPGMG